MARPKELFPPTRRPALTFQFFRESTDEAKITPIVEESTDFTVPDQDPEKDGIFTDLLSAAKEPARSARLIENESIP